MEKPEVRWNPGEFMLFAFLFFFFGVIQLIDLKVFLVGRWACWAGCLFCTYLAIDRAIENYKLRKKNK
jgi:hypothetical protein